MKKACTLLLMLLLSSRTFAQVSVWDGSWEPWTHGTGTEADPFLIENAQQLAYLAYRVNNGLDAGGGHVSNHNLHYKLMVDVDLNGSDDFQWTPIGYWNSDTDYQCFGGCFDGNGHEISGVFINSAANRVGFFGFTDGTTIMNLCIIGDKITTTGNFVGGIVGVANATTHIANCNNYAGVFLTLNSWGECFAGGIVGIANGSIAITKCNNIGTISINGCNPSSGGIIGYANTGAIECCNNRGDVSSVSDYCSNQSGFSTYYSDGFSGGIVGHANTITITNCFNTGNASSNTSGHNPYSGGILGSSGTANIINCYNLGTVSSSTHNHPGNCHSGGIVGKVNMTNIANSYNAGSLSGDASYTGGIIGVKNNGSITNSYYKNTCGGNNTHGGQPISNETMQSTEFVDILNDGLCAWEYDYSHSNSGYPVLTMIVVDAITSDATNVTQSHAILHGVLEVENTGVHSQGFEYKKITDSHYQTIIVSGNGAISTTISGLTPNTEYIYRVFCTPEDCGTYYGEEKTFTTQSVSVTTNNPTNVTQTHATINGNINKGDAEAVAQGFEYKQSSASSYQIVNVWGFGNVSYSLSGLLPNTSYTYRTFCTITGFGTTYGEEKTFTTQPVSVTTYYATDVTGSSAILQGAISIGDATLVSKGFEYRKVDNPNYTTVNVAGNDDNFTAQITGLMVNTTYEYRAFMNITENATTYYGNTSTFEVSWLNSDTICIDNADMLRWVSEQCNSGTTFQGKYIKLMNDITLPLNVPNNMTSIGVYPNYPFKGTFDGNGKHITNLYIDQPNTPYQGFFGYTLNANLYNVGLVNITASGRNYTGGMVAYAENTYLRDCYVNGGTLFALSYCGGLVGYQQQGTNSIISGCYNTCEVSGNNYVGGLVGFSNYSTVRNSYVAAMVAAQGDAVGSIIGGANEVLMYYCYFNSELTGQTNAIGWNNTGGGKDGGEAMTSAQMRDPQFVATLNSGLTVHVWKQDYAMHINNGFPILQWQVSTGVEENGFIKAAVYPNPTNGTITIEAEDLKQITISNMFGQVIHESNASGNVFEYDFGKHGTGLYLIRIKTANGVALKKVSVVR